MKAYQGDVLICGPGADLAECNRAIRRAKREAGAALAKRRQYTVTPENQVDEQDLDNESERSMR